MIVPSKVFLTKGVGIHKEKLHSFELALRDAGIAFCNLITVSSILPPGCRIIPKIQGVSLLAPGQISFCVLARCESNEPNRHIVASIGLASPRDKNCYGYISEHHGFGQTAQESGDYAEDLAASMLATTLGIPFDPEIAWSEKEKVFKTSGMIFDTRNITQAARVNKNGLWTTVIAVAMFIAEWANMKLQPGFEFTDEPAGNL